MATGAQPAMPAMPQTAARASSRPSGTATANASGSSTRSTRKPSFTVPRPSPKRCIRSPLRCPIASQPGTYGSGGCPPGKRPAATARSIGFSATAAISNESVAVDVDHHRLGAQLDDVGAPHVATLSPSLSADQLHCGTRTIRQAEARRPNGGRSLRMDSSGPAFAIAFTAVDGEKTGRLRRQWRRP